MSCRVDDLTDTGCCEDAAARASERRQRCAQLGLCTNGPDQPAERQAECEGKGVQAA